MDECVVTAAAAEEAAEVGEGRRGRRGRRHYLDNRMSAAPWPLGVGSPSLGAAGGVSAGRTRSQAPGASAPSGCGRRLGGVGSSFTPV